MADPVANPGAIQDDPAPLLSQEMFLSGKAIENTGDGAPQKEPSQAVRFQILGELGRGGMGIVYRARQAHPSRVMALKVLKRSLSDAHSQKRFLREMEITGRLSDRGVAQLYFAGYLEDGQPFMAMEYIQGTTLTDYAALHKLTREQRLRLFVRVCEIVAFAHRHGVIHRDLKPSNILVTTEGEPKVLDFGLAALPLDLEASQLTIQGQMVGTLDYMSPEQAEGQMSQVGYRSDVYSLGVILYELLASKRPFDFSGTSMVEAVKTIRESIPPRLSSVHRSYRGDLDNIVHKALSKDRAARYASVEELAEDVLRWLAHEPILARAPSLTYRARRFVRRHRTLVASASLIFASLAAGLITTKQQATHAAQEAQRADAGYQLALQNKRDREVELAGSEVKSGYLAWIEGKLLEARAHQDKAITLFQGNGKSAHSAFLALADYDRASGRLARVIRANSSDVACVTLWQDEKHLAYSTKGSIFVSDPLSSNNANRFEVGGVVQALTSSPDSTQLLVTHEKGFAVWSIETQSSILEIPATQPGVGSLNNQCVAFAGDHKLVLYSLNGSFPPRQLRDRIDIRQMQLREKDIVLVDSAMRVLTVDCTSGSEEFIGQLPVMASSMAISPDGNKIACASDSLTLYDLGQFASPRTLGSDLGKGLILKFGFTFENEVFILNKDFTCINIYDGNGNVRFRVPASRQLSISVGKRLAAVGMDEMGLAVWTTQPVQNLALAIDQAPQAAEADISSDGLVAAIAKINGKIALVGTIDGTSLGELSTDGPTRTIRFNGDTTSVAIQGANRRVQILDLKDGTAAKLPLEAQANTGIIAFSSAGDLLAATYPAEKLIRFLKRNGPTWQVERAPCKSLLRDIILSADGRYAYLIDTLGHAELWLTSMPHEVAGPPPNDITWHSNIVSGPNDPAGIQLFFSRGREIVHMPQLFRYKPLDVLSSDQERAVVVDGSSLYWVDASNQSATRGVPSDARHIRLSYDGRKMLGISSRDARFWDFELPEVLRGLEGGAAGVHGDPTAMIHWLIAMRQPALAGELLDQQTAQTQGQFQEQADELEIIALARFMPRSQVVRVIENSSQMTKGTKALLLKYLLKE
jgi:tRNA A-37 threonylcarbamoyl transferase component Bud32/WD40 repeat protein